MWTPEGKHFKISVLVALTGLTLAIHYGWVMEPIFGHVHWIHAIHGRFCYVPIVVAASWFGLRGGLYMATVISVLVMPLVLGQDLEPHEFASELVEIVFYYFIAFLTGALVDREFLARRKQQEAELHVERSQKLSLAGQIAAGVAHEIKNPLASIKGAADILADDSTSMQARAEFKAILHDEVRRIDGTVGEFLTFARPREARLRKTDLSEVVNACVKQMSTQAKQRGLSLSSKIQSDLFVNGDPEKLHQLTLNLLLNSLQASQPGQSVRILLRTEKDRAAVLTIEDSGAGIELKDLDRVYEPFFTTKSSGSGLGLAIVKSIVDNHNGQIHLYSAPNEETKATVTIPLWDSRSKS